MLDRKCEEDIDSIMREGGVASDLLFSLRRAEALLMDGPAGEFLDEEAVKKMSRDAIEKAGGECLA